jgi:16S rRNA (guanine(1405)-N(7))-methyltransferase
VKNQALHSELSNQVVQAVLSGKKYRAIAPELVHAIATAELAKGRSLKEAIKATKNQLHQSAAAYQVGQMDYEGWSQTLRRAYAQADANPPRAQLQAIMAHHASTHERLPILEEFYAEIFRHLPPIHSLLDVACGLNPLAHPWMALAPGATYYACDIYQDQIHFLNRFFEIAGIQGRAEVRDVISDCPTDAVDLALVLKTIPCLEQIDRHAGARLLDRLNARYLVISFPVRSLGGRSKGMAANYDAHFQDLVAGCGWQVTRFEFGDELAFLATTNRQDPPADSPTGSG